MTDRCETETAVICALETQRQLRQQLLYCERTTYELCAGKYNVQKFFSQNPFVRFTQDFTALTLSIRQFTKKIFVLF